MVSHFPHCPPVCGLICWLCRHLLASMEGQNVPYKLRNGTLTHTSNPASDVGSFTLSGCQRFTLVPKTTRTYKETKPILRELESSGSFHGVFTSHYFLEHWERCTFSSHQDGHTFDMRQRQTQPFHKFHGYVQRTIFQILFTSQIPGSQPRGVTANIVPQKVSSPLWLLHHRFTEVEVISILLTFCFQISTQWICWLHMYSCPSREDLHWGTFGTVLVHFTHWHHSSPSKVHSHNLNIYQLLTNSWWS